MRRLQVLDALENSWADCVRCGLSEHRTRVVGWRGNPFAEVFVVGEAPGENEDHCGVPFVGAAGHLLDAALVEANRHPAEDVFIANAIGCRPPGNRKPGRDEIKACASRLQQFLITVRPRALLLLGATAARMAGAYSVTRQRGVETAVDLFCYDGEIREWPAVVSYHPAYVLRTGGRGSQTFHELVGDIQLAYELVKSS